MCFSNFVSILFLDTVCPTADLKARWTRRSYALETLQKVNVTTCVNAFGTQAYFDVSPFTSRDLPVFLSIERLLEEDDGEDATTTDNIHQNDIIAYQMEKETDDG